MKSDVCLSLMKRKCEAKGTKRDEICASLSLSLTQSRQPLLKKGTRGEEKTSIEQWRLFPKKTVLTRKLDRDFDVRNQAGSFLEV